MPNGEAIPVRSASQAQASASATHPPVMLAVRVPPSAWSTSQSTRMVYSPKAMVPIAARSDRPDQPLNLLGASARAVALALGALQRGARQHGVLGGDPTLAACPS